MPLRSYFYFLYTMRVRCLGFGGPAVPSAQTRSLNGEGMFNWRLTYQFHYLPTEDKIVVHKKKNFLSFAKEEIKLPPIFALQVFYHAVP